MFEGVFGGPPCTKWWSSAANIAKARGQTVQPDMIPEYIRCVDECAPGLRPFPEGSIHPSPVDAFCELWDSINAKRGHSWESNPWVWILEFRRVEAPA